MSMTRTFTFGFLAAVLSGVLLVFIADPYGLIRPFAPLSISKHKYFIAEFEREIKLSLATRYPAEAGLFGTSRVAVGIDPDDVESKLAQVAYNYAVNGAKLSEIEILFQATVQSGMKTAIVGLDMSSFSSSSTPQKSTMASLLEGDLTERFEETTRRYLSLTALRHSALTLVKNAAGEPPVYSAKGMYLGYEPGTTVDPAAAPGDRNPPPLSDAAYLDLGNLIDAANSNGVDLRLFITPSNSRRHREDPRRPEWLARICAIAAERNTGIADFSFAEWDAENGEKFVDIGHFNGAIGARIVESLLQTEVPVGCHPVT